MHAGCARFELAQPARHPDHSDRPSGLGGGASRAAPAEASEAQQCIEVVKQLPDPSAKALADWMLGLAQHHLGRYAEARVNLQQALEADTEASRLIQLREVGWDWRISCLAAMSNLLWVRGFPDQAARIGAAAIDDAQRLGYTIPIGVAMIWRYFNKYLVDIEVDTVETDLVDFVERARTHGIVHDHGVALSRLALPSQTRPIRGG